MITGGYRGDLTIHYSLNDGPLAAGKAAKDLPKEGNEIRRCASAALRSGIEGHNESPLMRTSHQPTRKEPVLRSIPFAVLCSVFLLAGCDKIEDVTANRVSAPTIERTVMLPPGEVSDPQAIDDLNRGETFAFRLDATDIEGNRVSLADLKGQVVVVDVWGTWCPPCRAEVPSFVRLQAEFADQGLQIIGLNYERGRSERENLQTVKDFIRENGVNYPCLMGDAATRDQIPNFRGFPTTLFIDRQGRVRLQAVGLHGYDYLETAVRALLAEPV